MELARGLLPLELRDEFAIYVVIFAIGLTDWPQFARVARGATLVETNKEYVQAARIIGLPSWLIMVRHILPNTLRPILVIATIGLALAIIAEATLSFLGQGIPPTTPSLGTLIRVGNEYLFSGLWWITLFPADRADRVGVFAVNLLGDWLRDALEPETAMSYILDINGLNMQFPTRRGTVNAAQRRLFDCKRARFWGWSGESGAGKSTIGNAIIDLLEAPGRVTGGINPVQGEELRDMNRR